MKLLKPILTSTFFITLHGSPLLDPDTGPAACLGTRVLWSGTLSFSNRGGYIYYMEHRLKSDLSALFQIAQEISKETRIDSRSADYKQVSHAANRIRKLANRIKSGLTLGNLPVEEKALREADPRTLSPELLRGQVDELNRLVYKIRQSSAGRSKHVIDAKLQQEFYAEIDTLETLANQVKANADELMLRSE
jgi:hypothetical protein